MTPSLLLCRALIPCALKLHKQLPPPSVPTPEALYQEGVKWGMGWVVVGTAVLGGRPDFASFCGKMLYFPGFWLRIGAPQKRPFLPPILSPNLTPPEPLYALVCRNDPSGGVKQGRFVILRFHLSQDNQMLENSTKSVIATPLFVCTTC